MSKKIQVAAIAALGLSAIVTDVSAAVISFDAAEDGDFALGETYSENGYTIEVVQGEHFGFVDGALYFGPGDGFAPYENIVSFKRDDGGLFSFNSLDFASMTDGTDSELVHLQALIDGEVVETYYNIFSTTNVFETLDPSFRNFIDELRIVSIDGGRHAAIIFDNIDVSEVPLPAAVWMFLAGLGGLGFARKKHAVRGT